MAPGSILITGSAFDDTLAGGGGNDTMAGGDGNDQLERRQRDGRCRWPGGLGNDSYTVDAAGDVVTEAANGETDRVLASSASYVLAAHVENLTGTAATGQRALTGNDLANAIVGGSARRPARWQRRREATLRRGPRQRRLPPRQSRRRDRRRLTGQGTDRVETAMA